MTRLRDLSPGDRFTVPEMPGLYRLDDLDGGVAFSRRLDTDYPVTRVFDARLRVTPIEDRRYGPEPERAGRSKPPEPAYGGDPLSRAGETTGPAAPRTAHGSNPGALARLGAIRLDHGRYEVVDNPRRIEDVLDLGFMEFTAALLAFGAVGWALGPYSPWQAAGAFVLACLLGFLGYRKRMEDR